MVTRSLSFAVLTLLAVTSSSAFAEAPADPLKPVKVLAKKSVQVLAKVADKVADAVAGKDKSFSSTKDKNGVVHSCYHPDHGKWGYGSSPTGCDADKFGNVGRIKSLYSPYVFEIAKIADKSHRKEYVTNVYALMKSMAIEFYKSVQPKASAVEIDAFTTAVLSVGAQETYMSHYRIGADGRYKLMTGDKYISHGMMQVNQAAFAKRQGDSSFDLVGNIHAGYEIFYKHYMSALDTDCYKRAAKAKGVTQAKLLLARARGAYGAYNGGGGQLCRYTDAKNPYRKHDTDYLDKYQTKQWMMYVTGERKSTLNTRCILDGDDLCGGAKPPVEAEPVETQIINRPIVFADGLTCLSTDGKNLDCARDLRTFACLAKYNDEALSADPVRLAKAEATMKITKHDNRDELCKGAVSDLFSIGDFVATKSEMKVRDRLDGRVIGSTVAGRGYQIVDYDVRLSKSGTRYYKIRFGKVDAWIFAGDSASTLKTVERKTLAAAQAAAQVPVAAPVVKIDVAAKDVAPKKEQKAAPAPVAAPAPTEELNPAVPVKGTSVQLTAAAGIMLRETAGKDGAPIRALPIGTKVTVEDVITQGDGNEVYLKVTMNKKTGYLYAGHTYPTVTVQNWVKVVK